MSVVVPKYYNYWCFRTIIAAYKKSVHLWSKPSWLKVLTTRFLIRRLRPVCHLEHGLGKNRPFYNIHHTFCKE